MQNSPTSDLAKIAPNSNPPPLNGERHPREIIESWRQDYNEVRPHSSLKGKTPKEFADSMAGLY